MLSVQALRQSVVEAVATAAALAGVALWATRDALTPLADGIATAIVDHLKKAKVSVDVAVRTDGFSHAQGGLSGVLTMGVGGSDSETIVLSSTMPDATYRVQLTPVAVAAAVAPWWVVLNPTMTGFEIVAYATPGDQIQFGWTAAYPGGSNGSGSGTGTIS